MLPDPSLDSISTDDIRSSLVRRLQMASQWINIWKSIRVPEARPTNAEAIEGYYPFFECVQEGVVVSAIMFLLTMFDDGKHWDAPEGSPDRIKNDKTYASKVTLWKLVMRLKADGIDVPADVLALVIDVRTQALKLKDLRDAYYGHRLTHSLDQKARTEIYFPTCEALLATFSAVQTATLALTSIVGGGHPTAMPFVLGDDVPEAALHNLCHELHDLRISKLSFDHLMAQQWVIERILARENNATDLVMPEAAES